MYICSNDYHMSKYAGLWDTFSKQYPPKTLPVYQSGRFRRICKYHGQQTMDAQLIALAHMDQVS